MFQLAVQLTNCTLLGLDGNTSLELQQPPDLAMGAMKCVFAALGLTNLVLNSLSLLVFLCHRQKESIIRLLLLMLSSTEVLASFGMTSVSIARLLLEVAPHRVTYASGDSARQLVRYLSVTWVMANAFLLARNWCVVLIAVSRCEAVVRPFSRNTGRCCGHRTVGCMFACILLLGLAFGIPKAFQEKYVYCVETGRIEAKVPLFPFAFYGEFYLSSMFFQAVLPVILVSVASVSMTIGLRRHRSVGVGGSQAHMKATRMVQLLLIVFVCMEMPMFLTVLIGVKVPDDSEAWDSFMKYSIELANLCINLDSTCNFIVYMKANSTFRAVILRRNRHRKLLTSGVCAGGGHRVDGTGDGDDRPGASNCARMQPHQYSLLQSPRITLQVTTCV